MNKTKIGIFQGKAAGYNQAILKNLLIRGPSTSWEIAKAIQLERNPTVKSDALIYRSQKIYSVLARKGGTLDRLLGKGYIYKEQDKWFPSFPKVLILLIEMPEVVQGINSYYEETALRKWKKQIQTSKVPRKIKGPFGMRVQLNPTQLKLTLNKFLNQLSVPKMLLVIAEKMKELHQEGIDLDRINNDTLYDLITHKLASYIKGTHSFS